MTTATMTTATTFLNTGDRIHKVPPTGPETSRAEHQEMDIQHDPADYQNVMTVKDPELHGRVVQNRRAIRVAGVCVALMLILLGSLNIILRLYFTSQVSSDPSHPGCDTLPTQADPIRYDYETLVRQRDQIQRQRNELQRQRDELQRQQNELQRQLNEPQRQRDELQRQRDELQQRLNTLVKSIDTPDWIYFQSSIYYVSTRVMTWSNSRDFCRRNGADLVIINNKKEQEFVEMLRRGETAWIGLSDLETESHWKWVDGTRLTVNFWWSQEPNDYEGNEDCVTTGYKPTDERPVTGVLNTWNDDSCHHTNVFICEKRILIE